MPVITSDPNIRLNGTAFSDVIDVALDVLAATLENDGGTFNAKTGEAVTDFGANDYIVGGAQDTTIVRDLLHNLREAGAAIAAHIQRIPVNGRGEKRYFVGTWVYNGDLYIDSSEVVTGRINARRLARERNEIAFYDPLKNESIDTD